MILYLFINKWTEKIGTILIKIGKCRDSHYCGRGNFCNFDFGSSGMCESCAIVNTMANTMATCESLGLISEKGENECKAVCKGENFIATGELLPINLK